jgi:hypothetical protein
MTTVSSELLARVSQLRDTVLKSMSYAADVRDMQLSFQHWNGSVLSLHLRGILQLSVSSIDDQSGDPVVVSAKIEMLEDGGKEVLASLGYMWYDTDKNVKTYPGSPLVYFLIEGDTCIGVVCREVELKSVKAT